MPFVEISPPIGPLKVFYSIATPDSYDANAINPNLPTILFLHPTYIGQQIFEAQFSDHTLRQFNLISFDMRSYGFTEGFIGDTEYYPTEDVLYFIEALNLPPCHIFGLSIGCCLGVDLATSHPDRVLSLTLCSPLTPVETGDIVAGRMQVHDSWCRGLAELYLGADDSAQEHQAEAVSGVNQLGFNNVMDSLTSAITESAIMQALMHWAGSTESTNEAYKAAVEYPLSRKPSSSESLSKIKSPVMIIHCSDDLVYPEENADSLEIQLRNLGIKVECHKVPGPHYGCIVSASEINPLVHEFVASCHPNSNFIAAPTSLNREDAIMRTPFDEHLEKYNYYPADYALIQLGLC